MLVSQFRCRQGRSILLGQGVHMTHILQTQGDGETSNLGRGAIGHLLTVSDPRRGGEESLDEFQHSPLIHVGFLCKGQSLRQQLDGAHDKEIAHQLELTGLTHILGLEINDTLGHGGEIRSQGLDGFGFSAGQPDQLSGMGRWGATKDGALQKSMTTSLDLGQSLGKFAGDGGVDGTGVNKDHGMGRVLGEGKELAIDGFHCGVVGEGSEEDAVLEEEILERGSDLGAKGFNLGSLAGGTVPDGEVTRVRGEVALEVVGHAGTHFAQTDPTDLDIAVRRGGGSHCAVLFLVCVSERVSKSEEEGRREREESV